jgi:hypothetical protein
LESVLGSVKEISLLEFTGVLAVVLVFLSGPYRTLQKRLPRRWGPVLSVWAHANISIGAATAIFVHVLLLDDGGFEGASASLLNGPSVTWLATLLFATSAAVGVTALYVTSAGRARRRWLGIHRRLTWLFYLAIIPHVFGEGVLAWPVVLLALAAWGVVAARPRLKAALSRPIWPRFGRWKQARAGSSRLPRAASASLAVLLPLAIGALSFAAVRTPGGDAQLELTGTIAETYERGFSLETEEESVWIRVSGDTEMEAGVGLTALRRRGTVISVGVARERDGTVLATEVELA